ncbi:MULTISPECIES: hypothetical protein [Pseudomonas syringae group]|nr:MULTISPECIES: hypothetical protein [Pseudomonas syringae group]KPC39440.1 Unknown protein sequence [Pseudomonas amygdali pv. morsprunorum]KPX35929.1 hypothetical protein ALO69_200039 [Pseudomonas ficuserectae]RMS38527.1 hypothetical protein ALP68_200139 [Pseudomonas ficuserectae]RMS41937.1 hypothetical protein ALP67_03683 [Pseudomonas ficuserectae]
MLKKNAAAVVALEVSYLASKANLHDILIENGCCGRDGKEMFFLRIPRV